MCVCACVCVCVCVSVCVCVCACRAHPLDVPLHLLTAKVGAMAQDQESHNGESQHAILKSKRSQ